MVRYIVLLSNSFRAKKTDQIFACVGGKTCTICWYVFSTMLKKQ